MTNLNRLLLLLLESKLDRYLLCSRLACPAPFFFLFASIGRFFLTYNNNQFFTHRFSRLG